MNGISIEPNGFSLSVETSIYSIEAIKRTAYKFADRASVIINPGPAYSVSVTFNFIGQNAKHDPKQVISDFCNELLDQDLRELIKKETGALRNVIIAHAFSGTRLASKD